MNLSSKQLQQIVSHLSVGLNYIVEPTTSLSGILDKQQRHPAATVFASWVSSHLENIEFCPKDSLGLLDAASQIGCQGYSKRAPILIEQVLGALQKSPIESEMFDVGYALCSGMRLCERESFLLSEDILLRIVKSQTYNANHDALNLLMKQCDGRIIPQLIAIYADPQNANIKESIFSALEKLAGRYGKRIIRDGVQLKAVEW